MRRLSAILLIISALVINILQVEPATGGSNVVAAENVIPCYVVVSDEIRDNDELREITILMSSEDVTEVNFFRLHRHFAVIYPHVKRLSVYVHTSFSFTLGNYPTVEEVERRKADLPTKPKVWEKDAQGILIRTDEMEKFGYKGEGGDIRDMKYVLLRGEEPDCNNCERLVSKSSSGATAAMADFRKGREDSPCYFMFANSVRNNRRVIGLFINANDGTEANLRVLLRAFSRRYGKTEPLAIKVYTNLKQKSDFVAPILGDYVVQAMYEDFSAVLFRDSNDEVIRYRRPNEKVITVVVRGIDIFPDL